MYYMMAWVQECSWTLALRHCSSCLASFCCVIEFLCRYAFRILHIFMFVLQFWLSGCFDAVWLGALNHPPRLTGWQTKHSFAASGALV